MTAQRARPLVAANWKMNGDRSMASAFVPALAHLVSGTTTAEIVICPPAVLIERMTVAVAAAHWRGEAPSIGAQDCHAAPSGAHTGDLSAAMLKEAGARWMILGHSERRAGHAEGNVIVAAKLAAADAVGLSVILCVGESLAERDSGRAEDVVRAQLSGSLLGPPQTMGADGARFAIAYEPVWAIGTGRVASDGDVAAMHAAIRAHLLRTLGGAGAAVRILYGGSVKPDNAPALLATADVGGLLVGGASLVPESFASIANAAC
jgi:triosephosphate isomerase